MSQVRSLSTPPPPQLRAPVSPGPGPLCSATRASLLFPRPRDGAAQGPGSWLRESLLVRPPPRCWTVGGAYFMHPECCWHRATGTLTTQRGKAASKPPEAASSSRLSSRCPLSPASARPHLQAGKPGSEAPPPASGPAPGIRPLPSPSLRPSATPLASSHALPQAPPQPRPQSLAPPQPLAPPPGPQPCLQAPSHASRPVPGL